MRPVKRMIKPNGHLIENRGWETVIGLFLFIIGAVLIWDAFDGRGKSLPWPAGAVTPW